MIKIIKREAVELLFSIHFGRAEVRMEEFREEWNRARVETGEKFFLSLPAEDRERMFFQEFEPDFETREIVGRWSLRDQKYKEGSQWAFYFKREMDKRELAQPMAEMDDAKLAGHLRKFPAQPSIIAEALARILEQRVINDTPERREISTRS